MFGGLRIKMLSGIPLGTGGPEYPVIPQNLGMDGLALSSGSRPLPTRSLAFLLLKIEDSPFCVP